MKRYIETVKTLNKIANGKKWVLVQMFISCSFYNLASLLPPLATSGIIAVITNNNFNGIWYYVFLYVVFYILYFTTKRWNYKTYSILADYYHLEVQRLLFDHVANNESIFDKISKGKIVDTCSDDIRYLVDVMDSASEALMRFIELIVIFIIFAYYNVYVAVIVILLDMLYLKLMNANSKKVSLHYEGTRKYEDKVIDILNQMLANLKQVKSLNMMPSLNDKLDKTRIKWKEEYKGKRKYIIDRYCTIPYLVYAGKILLYIFLAYLVINEKMTLDRLVLLISYFEMTISCTDYMLDYLLNLSNYGIRVDRIKTILDYAPEKEVDFGCLDNDYIKGLVEFKRVNVKIKNKQVLSNISFKAKPNEITALVGHSGSGKSTIINLLYRLYRVNSGEILIDNESIYNYSKKVFFSNVSGVYQQPFVFEMSIKDNLSLIDSNTKNQIEACKRVGIHELIESLPKGYNTVISSEEHLLTDGEKQLLAIARSLLTKAEILLFDEATSNVDPETTMKIREIIMDLKSDHTIILVTHKPEIMEIADNVVVIDDGKVLAKGINEEVLEKCMLYKELRNRTFASISNNQ